MIHSPNTVEQLRIIRNNYRVFGLRQTVKDLLIRWLERSADTFDEDHSVSTRLSSGFVMPLAAGSADATSVENGHGYEPTPSALMNHILEYLQQLLPSGEFCFIDLGSGRGRTLLMAATREFKEVIGVELSAEHCAAARRNLASYRAKQRSQQLRSPIRICHEDVTKFELPQSHLLVYLFNPFRGSVLQGVLDRLADFRRTTGHRVYIVLSHPELESVFREHPALVLQHEYQVIDTWSSWNLWEVRA
jgi:SAM-dependent methyltransferase